MSENEKKPNPFARASDPKAQTPNNLSGSYVLPGSGSFVITDVKLVNNELEGKMFHVWELEKIQHSNPDQATVCAFMARIQPDPYMFGIKDSKAIAAAALGVAFEDVDANILAASTTDEGKKSFVGAVIQIDTVTAVSKAGKEITKSKFTHVSAAPAAA